MSNFQEAYDKASDEAYRKTYYETAYSELNAGRRNELVKILIQGLASFAIANYLDDREDKKKEKAVAKYGKAGRERQDEDRLNILAMRGMFFLAGGVFSGVMTAFADGKERDPAGRDLKKTRTGNLCPMPGLSPKRLSGRRSLNP